MGPEVLAKGFATLSQTCIKNLPEDFLTLCQQWQQKGLIELLLHTKLTSYSTLRLGGFGHVIEIRQPSICADLLPLLNNTKIPYRVVGLGSNQVLFDDYRYLYIHVNFEVNPFSEYQDEYIFLASAPVSQITQLAIKHNLKGFEVITGIPASIGGVVFMNAGTSLGEVSQIVTQIDWYDPLGIQHQKQFIDANEIKQYFSYRHNSLIPPGSIITQVTLRPHGQDPKIGLLIQEYLLKRKETQPLKTKNCGCTFKNPSKFTNQSAAKLIDDLGLKGFTYKDFRISPIHANFIENIGTGTPEDFFYLVKMIQKKVWDHYQIELEVEIQW